MTELQVAPQTERPGSISASCPVCESGRSAYVLRAGDDRWGHFPEEFEVRRCLDCDLMFIWPRPTDAELDEAYNAGEVAYHDFERNVPSTAKGLRALAMNVFLLNLRWVPPLPRGARLLDVGCSTGEFLSGLKDRGWELHGADVSTAAVEYGRKAYGLDLHAGELPDIAFPDNHFDGVIAWHTVEHLTDVRATFREIARILKPGGYFVFVVPNAGSWQRRAFGRYWYPLHLPYHLYQFTPKRLTALVEQDRKLDVEKILFGPLQASVVPSLGLLISRSGLGGERVKRLAKNMEYFDRLRLTKNLWALALRTLLLPFSYALIPFGQTEEMAVVCRKR